jgi:hypothetical protein
VTRGPTFGGALLIAAGLLGLYFMGTASYGTDKMHSGNYHFAACKAASIPALPGDFDKAFFQGNCFGTADTLMIVGRFLREPFRFCQPLEVSTAQGLKVAVAYMEAHPEMLHLDLSLLMVDAFRQAWPCKQ